MNNIRIAILKAADWIENNPHLYAFRKAEVPECGSPGCMVGWVGSFAGYRAGTNCWRVDAGCKRIIGVNCETYSDRIAAICRENNWFGGGAYTNDAHTAACAMRLYADRFHPAEPLIERKSGSEICRAIIAKPFRETADA